MSSRLTRRPPWDARCVHDLTGRRWCVESCGDAAFLVMVEDNAPVGLEISSSSGVPITFEVGAFRVFAAANGRSLFRMRVEDMDSVPDDPELSGAWFNAGRPPPRGT